MLENTPHLNDMYEMGKLVGQIDDHELDYNAHGSEINQKT